MTSCQSIFPRRWLLLGREHETRALSQLLRSPEVRLVTDSGGVLSHSAVVAREYRIPAVVGTGNATSTFHDGQLLEVDGNAGTVRVTVDEVNNVEEIEHEPALIG